MATARERLMKYPKDTVTAIRASLEASLRDIPGSSTAVFTVARHDVANDPILYEEPLLAETRRRTAPITRIVLAEYRSRRFRSPVKKLILGVYHFPAENVEGVEFPEVVYIQAPTKPLSLQTAHARAAVVREALVGFTYETIKNGTAF